MSESCSRRMVIDPLDWSTTNNSSSCFFAMFAFYGLEGQKPTQNHQFFNETSCIIVLSSALKSINECITK